MKTTPLAWKNLTADWRRLALGVAGVAFAALLMFMQNGFRNALLDSPVQILRLLRCDLIAVSVARYSLPTDQVFPKTLFERSVTDADVVAATPLYFERPLAQLRVEGFPRRPIRVVGIPKQPGWFNDQTIESEIKKLSSTGTALLDRQSRLAYGFQWPRAGAEMDQAMQLAEQPLDVVGLINIGADFVNDGTLVVSHDSFAHFFPDRGAGRPLATIDLGLYRIRNNANPNAVADRLSKLDPLRWMVMTRQQLIDREIAFWNRQTPIGTIFFVGSMMGFAVGVIICYQILFNSIHDSLPEYATLKAMGYGNRFFVLLVVKQSLYLAILGFLPALATSWLSFQVINWAAGLPMLFTPSRIALVFGMTVVMCLVSGLMTVRRLLNADPASLF